MYLHVHGPRDNTILIQSHTGYGLGVTTDDCGAIQRPSRPNTNGGIMRARNSERNNANSLLLRTVQFILGLHSFQFYSKIAQFLTL